MESKKDPSKERLDQDDLNKRLKEEAEKAVNHKLKDIIHEKGAFTERNSYKLARMIIILIGIFGVGLLCSWSFGKTDPKEMIQFAEVLILKILLPVLTLIL